MAWTDKHIEWMLDTGYAITTACGMSAPVYRFNHVTSDSKTMSEWAAHFRNHYCEDNHLEYFIKDTPYTKSEYLLKIKFPAAIPLEKHEKTGPATRSGDFSEILVADYISSKLKYWVPRTRYELKINPNSSEQGTDVIAIKFDENGNKKHDELFVVEVKATLSNTKNTNRLQDAIDHSDKDEYRIGESLNAIKQRLFFKNKLEESDKIGRFQNPDDRPYIMKYGAAAVLSYKAYDGLVLSNADASKHKNKSKLNLFIIVGDDMMDVTHLLYKRAADEA